MAKLMLESHNLLALDEPTNHMDIRSKDILKKALKDFDGTLIIVSHDRDFLDGLVDKLYEFRDGQVKEHLGSVAEFLEKRKIENLQELERKFPDKKQGKKQVQSVLNENKEKNRQARKVRERIASLEAEITRLEGLMSDIETRLSTPGEGDDVMELTNSYLEYKRELENKTEEWGGLI